MSGLKTTYLFAIIAALMITPGYSVFAQSDHGFRFVRVKYGDSATGWVSRFGETWSHDYPTAEYNFYEALERTTRIHVERPSLVLTLDDAEIFEYPVLYLCEPGYWEMTDEQVNTLREYFDRGGFMLLDDFRGEDEWYQFYTQLKRLFPELEPVELTADHPIWSIYYEVDPEATPSLVSFPGRGRGGGRDFGGGPEDKYFGVFDESGRLMMMICYNQDLGDGWEWPEFNVQDASLATFQMGVNFLIYALTH